MKLLKAINTPLPQRAVAEDAGGGAVGAGGVAGNMMPLFSTLVKRASAPSTKPIDGPYAKKKTTKRRLKIKEAFDALSEDLDPSAVDGSTSGSSKESAIDTSDTIARLKSLENRELKDKRDVVVFGLEDDNGGIVRVSIKPEQAEEFEQALQQFINSKESEDEVPEIAELLFNMRDHFDIIDVSWPEVQEDEEQVGDIQGTDQQGTDELGAGEDAGELPPPAEDTTQVKDLLTQVIDMMKADAGARYAEAKAREAEAKTKEADAIVAQTMARVRQEEQYLDMETEQKAKKDEEKEAKRLANLAKWKRGVSNNTGAPDDNDVDFASQNRQEMPQQATGGEEEEFHRPSVLKSQPSSRVPTVKSRVAPRDIASFILKRVQ